MQIKYTASTLIILTVFISCKSYPQGPPDEVEVEMMPEPLVDPPPSKFKQEDADTDVEAEETTPRGPSFGSQVAQIINGVATGNLGSILQGSFNLIPDAQVQQATNGAWETIAGITTTTTTTSTAAPTTQPTEAPTTTEVQEVEETKTEAVTPESTEAPPEDASAASSSPSSNNEDDDDEEESRAEGGEGEEDTETEDLDTSVYSRSKVLRVI